MRLTHAVYLLRRPEHVVNDGLGQSANASVGRLFLIENDSSLYISKAWRERPRHCGRGLCHEVPRNPPPSGDGDLLRVLRLSLKILL